MTAFCVLLIFSIFVGELLWKNKIERTLEENSTRELFGGRILLRRHHNRGLPLNIGSRKRPLVAALSLVLTLALAIVFLFSLGHRGNHLLRLGLALLLGGAFSNTYDRMKRKYVVDYVSFGVKWRRLQNIVFNVSDFCIIIGALLSALGGSKAL